MSVDTPESQAWDAQASRDRRRSEPGATYRVQLTGELGFDQVAEHLDYFAALGVTDLYLSPIMRARSGSMHGYDVVDPTQVSPALGGEAALRALSDAAATRGIRLLADIVPNHLATSDENPMWEQLLAEGMSGPSGSLFDVDWRPPLPTAEGKVILPVLGDTYGQVLVAGELELVRIDGVYRMRYHDRTFPLRQETLELIDARGGSRAFSGIAGVLNSWQPLHSLLERQHYRLVHWRIGDAVVNYRRFFTINDLAAVRVEVPEVFERTHSGVLDLVLDGVISGLRIDHPDGLRDPERYLQQLRNRTGVWIVVEKVLYPGERLPGWGVAGTTGYDFCNDVLGLYIDADALPELREIDGRLGGGRPYTELAVEGKTAVLEAGLRADLDRVAHGLWRVTQQHPQVRDVTLDWCRALLAGTLAQFAVYRSYVDPETGAAHERDRTQIAGAIERARASDGAVPAVLWDFVEELLAGEVGTGQALLDVIARFQQLCAAVTAKGTEDTAFYRYRTLLAACEVGADPSRPGRTVEQFQQANADRAERAPQTMLTTATQDTKRGEDLRLRMAAVSELIDLWRAAVDACEEVDEANALPAQSRYLIYQTVVGLWPLEGDPTDEHRDRLAAYVVKGEREAGLYTSWTDPDETFEDRLQAFARTLLAADTAPEALRTVITRAGEIGMVSGLGQVVLRTLSPGVPDCYQGTETWDDSLVDPDNRRTVPFDARRELLDGLADVPVDDLVATRRDGRIKALVLHRALRARAEHPTCVGVGSGYLALDVSGAWADHVVAFARVSSDASDALLVVAPRLPGAVMGDTDEPPVGDVWGDTTVRVPGFLQGTYRDAFSTGSGEIGDEIEVSSLLGNMPVAVLQRTADDLGGSAPGDDVGGSAPANGD
ncbi:MAG TPA: malto-oligosyltrehalose synthase [Euzebyales bacterium]|nr:malto-oligosyltrehalose synthase [Euzebyales bacterium]